MLKCLVLISYLREYLIDNVVKMATENAGVDDFEVIAKPSTSHSANISYNRMVEETESEIVCFLGDDCLPMENYLKEALKTMAEFDGGWGTVMMNDGTGRDRPSHMVVHRKMIPHLGGEIAHSGYFHTYSDIELIERSREIGRYAYSKESLVIHVHPILFKTCPVDKYYKISSDPQKAAEDKRLFEHRKANGWKTAENFNKKDTAWH